MNEVENDINDLWGDVVEDSNNDSNLNDDYLNSSDEIEFQRVGNKDYGYIDVPSDWDRFYDVNSSNTLQYSYANLWFMTMLAVENTNPDADSEYAKILLDSLVEDGCLETNSEHVKVGNYDAYKVSGYYSGNNIWLVMWTFLDEDNKLHYISIEGPDKDSEHFDLINTFSTLE